MKDKIQKRFRKYGYLLKSGLYTKSNISRYEAEFDKIIKQLRRSGENINARWKSCLTKDMESIKTSVVHTHNVQSFSSKMMEMIQNDHFLDCVEKIIGENIILHHTKPVSYTHLTLPTKA